jgi:hypothetical protein
MSVTLVLNASSIQVAIRRAFTPGRRNDTLPLGVATGALSRAYMQNLGSVNSNSKT